MVAQEINVEQEDELTLVYRYPMNPYTWKRVVWMIDYSENYLYGIRNLNNSTHFMQSRKNWPWRVQFAWETSQSQWTQWQFAYSDGSWTIQNKLSSSNGGGDNYYLGAWHEKQWINGEVLAGNKDGENVGHYKIYQILRTEYNTKAKQYATNVTSKITNPSFDDGDAFAQKKANAVGESITGWTIAEGGNYQYYTVGKSRSNTPDNDSGFGKEITAANGTKYVHIRHGWQNSATAISQTLSNLSVGEYTLTIDHKGATPRSKSPRFTVKATPTKGSIGGVHYSSYPTSLTRDNKTYTFESDYGDWSTISYTFFVTEAGDVVLYIGCTDSNIMNNSNDEVIFDNVNLTYKNYTATLQSALDRATLLYARTEDSDLNSAIAAAQTVLDNADNTESYQSTINSAVTALRTAIDTAYDKVTFASGENITFLLENASFESSEALSSNVTTSINDVSPTTNYASMQPLEGWDINTTEGNIASGIFEYNSELGIKDYPTTDISTPTVGNNNVLGLIAGWGSKVQYKQSVTLPAGRYTINVPVYNKYGETAFTKNLIGFIEDDGTEHLATTTTYTVGVWTTSTIEFDLNAETSGYMSVGYQSVANQGSGNMPRLYIDGFTITFTDAANVYEQARTAATATYNDAAYTNVAGSEKTTLYNAINPDPAPATVSEYFAAAETINAAVEIFTAAKPSYDAFVVAKTVEYADDQPYASAEKYAAIATAQGENADNAADAVTKTNAIVLAYRTYIESNAMAEGVVGAENKTSLIINANTEQRDQNAANWGWTKTLGAKDSGDQPYTDANGSSYHNYFDGGSWNESSWDVTFSQTINLPAGKYLLTVTSRAAKELTTFDLFAGENKAAMKHIDADVNTGIFGRGWNDNYLVFDQYEDGEIIIGVHGVTETEHNWMSCSRFRLVKIEDLTGFTIVKEMTDYVPEAGITNVVLTRSFVADKWNTLVLPFDLTETQVTATFGEDVQIASFTGFDENNIIQFSTNSKAIEANVPVLIKGATDVTAKLIENVTVNTATPSVTKDGLKFIGTYVATKMPVGAFFINKSGEFKKVVKDDTNSIKPLRAYFQSADAEVKGFRIAIDEEIATGIIGLETEDTILENGAYYTIQGIRVDKPVKGLYIHNGKKILVK